MRRLLPFACVLAACSPAPAPVAEVPVVAVSASPAGTAPPPPEPARLPSSTAKQRPMSDEECRSLVTRMVDAQLRALGIDPAVAVEQRAHVMADLEVEIQRCHGRPVTEKQAKCLRDAMSPSDVDRCVSD